MSQLTQVALNLQVSIKERDSMKMMLRMLSKEHKKEVVIDFFYQLLILRMQRNAILSVNRVINSIVLLACTLLNQMKLKQILLTTSISQMPSQKNMVRSVLLQVNVVQIMTGSSALKKMFNSKSSKLISISLKNIIFQFIYIVEIQEKIS